MIQLLKLLGLPLDVNNSFIIQWIYNVGRSSGGSCITTYPISFPTRVVGSREINSYSSSADARAIRTAQAEFNLGDVRYWTQATNNCFILVGY